jgi:dTDP-glucose 4,6-dehydratase
MIEQRAVILGAAGFIGSHLCDRFLAEGWRVTGVDNPITGTLRNVAHLDREPRFDHVRADVCQPLELAGPIHAVLDLASPASPVDYLAHPQRETYWGKVNPVGPRAVYDEAKRFAEAITMAYRRYERLDTRIARIFDTYGPRMRLDDGRVVPTSVGQALRGAPITVFGDGSRTRSFCHVDDTVECPWRLFRSTYREPVNVGTPHEMTMLELAAWIRAAVGTASEIVFEPLPEDDPRVRRPDVTRARQELGWEPRVSFEDGMQQTIAWFRAGPGRAQLGVAAVAAPAE